jgi:hypothetical protein
MKLIILLVIIVIIEVILTRKSLNKNKLIIDSDYPYYRGNLYSSNGVMYEGLTPPAYGHGYSYGPWKKIQMKKHK